MAQRIDVQAELAGIQARIPAGRERARALRQLAQRCMQAVGESSDREVKHRLVTMARHIQRRADRQRSRR
jgi:hypothetical protein